MINERTPFYLISCIFLLTNIILSLIATFNAKSNGSDFFPNGGEYYGKLIHDESFVDKLLEFDPQHDDFVSEESKKETHRIEYMKRVFEKTLDKEILDQGPAWTPLLKWAKTCVIIKDSSLEQRERSKMLMEKGLL